MKIRRLACPALLAALLGAVVAAALVGCSESALEQQLVDAIESSEGAAVEFGMVADAHWDGFLVVCPYDPSVSERLGFDWPDEPDTFRSDDYQTIVFVDDGAVVTAPSLSFDKLQLCSSEIWQLTALDQPFDFTQNAAGTWVIEQ
ncbi:hypothetical protein B0I08_105300 [Glaciihabitans tibetensis]|uniref:Lipoprotein n=1 Tax=Glaciihabitans tibetensis TaxID=1266600 RepID=A0A2T0VDD7_9MICO|nr:hypothetical protein [Glaciihabitans tibetensis]PRY68135.1 hypothetical protein B0I08_105300 [Glaciihabitans tibetensis]